MSLGPIHRLDFEWYQSKCGSALGRLQEEWLLEIGMLTTTTTVGLGRIYPALGRFAFCICFPNTKASPLCRSDVASKQEGWGAKQGVLKSQAGSERRGEKLRLLMLSSSDIFPESLGDGRVAVVEANGDNQRCCWSEGRRRMLQGWRPNLTQSLAPLPH